MIQDFHNVCYFVFKMITSPSHNLDTSTIEEKFGEKPNEPNLFVWWLSSFLPLKLEVILIQKIYFLHALITKIK